MVPSHQSRNAPMNRSDMIEFLPWYADGTLPDCSFEVGAIAYGTDGAFKLELRASGACETKVQAELVFESPLAVRIVQEGSLMDYWNGGFVVRGHNVFVTASSQFLDWLEHSSSGVHSVDRVRHFAVFTDDVCVEVLSSDVPTVYMRD